tara:strand:+ start:1033 stop:2382 length:1350 start_codon:yes stop_codon:yes gene_type:complete
LNKDSDADNKALMVDNVCELELDITAVQTAAALCLVESVADTYHDVCLTAFNTVLEGTASTPESYLHTSAATLGLSWLANDLHLDHVSGSEIIPNIVESLEKWTGSRELTSRTLIAVSSLANGNPESTSILLEVGVVPAIVVALSKCGHEDVVALAGMNALNSLCKTPQGCGNVVHRGGVEVITRELEQSSSEIRMQVTLHLMNTICKSTDIDSSQKLLNSEDLMSFMVTGMETYPHSLIVQSASMSALLAMSSNDLEGSVDNSVLLSNTKGLIECITSVLDEETTDRADVVVDALRVIGSIVTSDVSLATQCKEKGVDNSVLNAMTRYPTHSMVLHEAAEALKSMTSSSDVNLLVELITPTIASVEQDDQRVATSSARLLRKLANLSYVDGIMNDVDVPSIAEVLLLCLSAGDSLTDVDVKGPYLGACVAAMAGLANCGTFEKMLKKC